MNILCWNIKGIRGSGKIGAARYFMLKHKISFLGLVETKASSINDNMMQRLWGNFVCDSAFINATNGGGGILCMWDNAFFQQEAILKSER